MKYFDSHAHYYDERFESECSEGVDNLIGALLKDNVSGIINVGTSPETSRLAINQAKKHENMFTAIGIHPSDSQYLKKPLKIRTVCIPTSAAGATSLSHRSPIINE